MSLLHKDLYSNVDPVVSLVPLVRSADANGTGIDTRNFRAAMILIQLGAHGITFDTTNKIAFELEESDDNSTFTDVADIDIIDPKVGVVTGTVAMFDGVINPTDTALNKYRGTKRYVRVVANFIGTHGTGTSLAAHVVLGYPTIAALR
jgi:hypothetical protein